MKVWCGVCMISALATSPISNSEQEKVLPHSSFRDSPAGEQSSNANYGDPATRDYWEAVDDNPVPWYKPGVTLTRGGSTALPPPSPPPLPLSLSIFSSLELSKYSMKSLFPFSCGNPKVPLLDPPGPLSPSLYSLLSLSLILLVLMRQAGRNRRFRMLVARSRNSLSSLMERVAPPALSSLRSYKRTRRFPSHCYECADLIEGVRCFLRRYLRRH